MDEIRNGCMKVLREVKELERAYYDAVFEHENMAEYEAIKQRLFRAQSSAIIWLTAYAKIDINEEVKP